MKININKFLSLFIIMITISYTGIFAGYKACILLSGIVLFIGILGNYANSVKFNRINKYSPLWMLLILFLCLNSILNLPRSLFYFVIFLACILVMCRKIDTDEIEKIIKIYKVISLILAFSVFVQAFLPSLFYPFARIWFYYSNQYDILYNLGVVCHQYSGLFYEVSQAGFILSIGCVICFIQAYYKDKNRITDFIYFAILFFALILTGKRSLMLIVAALMGFFWLYNSIKKLTPIKAIALVLFTFVAVMMLDSIVMIVSQVLTKGEGGIELSGREKFWNLALDMFKESPVFGKGINSYDVYFNNSGIRELQYDFAGAHNSYFQLLAEIGILGFMLYIPAVISVLIKGIKFATKAFKNNMIEETMNLHIAIYIILVILAYALAGNPFHLPQQMYVLFLFMSVAVNLIEFDKNAFLKIKSGSY